MSSEDIQPPALLDTVVVTSTIGDGVAAENPTARGLQKETKAGEGEEEDNGRDPWVNSICGPGNPLQVFVHSHRLNDLQEFEAEEEEAEAEAAVLSPAAEAVCAPQLAGPPREELEELEMEVLEKAADATAMVRQALPAAAKQVAVAAACKSGADEAAALPRTALSSVTSASMQAAVAAVGNDEAWWQGVEAAMKKAAPCSGGWGEREATDFLEAKKALRRVALERRERMSRVRPVAGPWRK